MIPDLETYFGRLVPERDPLLLRLEEEAAREGIPIVGPVVGEFLFMMARLMGATKILELGTATGYSTIQLARACAMSNGHVVTLENDPEMARRARANFEEAGLGNLIEIKVADALLEVTTQGLTFDLIFLDIDKEDYVRVLPDCQRLLRNEGLLIADNVGFAGADGFNQAVNRSPGWRSVHMLSFLPGHSPERDGLCIALRV
jgi:predicted O-methyltransferase YrrM